MRVLPLCLIAVMFLARSAAADESEKLFGVWKLVSLTYEDSQTGEQKPLFGQHPKGSSPPRDAWPQYLRGARRCVPINGCLLWNLPH
jgi:hypothetical protein